MWRQWGQSPVKIHDRSSPFGCSSFKDIQLLCAADDPSSPNHTNNLNGNNAPKRAPKIFHRVRLASALIRALRPPEHEPEPNASLSPDSNSNSNNNGNSKATLQLQKTQRVEVQQPPTITIPGADKRIVVYFTSLRVVRSTFEDCKSVRSILRGFRVQLDERDLSMDSRFLNELQGILGSIGQSNKLTLPRVFIGGRYVGGAEEIRQLNESGELKKFVEGLPAVEPGVCDECGGYRFVLCEDCDGSHKLYAEKAGGFKSCTACNENGLIRCPSCSYGAISTV